ncbi:MAG TPA: enoyl-CoA hydratase-related protein [Hydrogenophaga sp.]|uniref:enoyl-CoA hydratase/isomerase family protein n=1 Tax=Hydrogenophaga sp. TaxID=1904254 RepID=UPI002CB8D6B5|nr:enoyl-CoA hydratase-related protein [Hydrogenophaga sp.]HMN93716.1 enoyl-CoA hydratase-related protein [Hydrogenophaga sp.]HMP09167.1 enoyl-CoA hydratase-related protein [Hydrogenophaga sp.]
MVSEAEVLCERLGAVAHVRLSHPGRLNAMSRAMWRQLREVFRELQDDHALRCVVVRGADGHFCAGGDIAEYPAFRFDEAALRDFHENDVWGGLSAMLACDLPVIACIEGNCMGAGVEIASCCDIRLAAGDARFGAPIARLGFPMAPREARLVVRTVGELTAREMLLGATVFDATEMKVRGFLSSVCPASQLQDRLESLVQRVVALAPQAARLNKQTLRAFSGESAIPTERLMDQAYAYATSAEHREGITAFLDKRQPRFGSA